MRILLGIILGVSLTVVAVFAYDTATGRASNGLSPSASGNQPPMVNWGVVSDEWHGLETNLQSLAKDVEQSVRRLTG
ncbi:MAG TPA: hypothetical protein VGJ20_05465 [Xanthobacteraceae bacterium]|jgi:hypothetical protein